MAVDYAPNFDVMDWSCVGVGMGFVEDQIDAFNQHPGSWRDFRAADSEARIVDQQSHLLFDCRVKPLGSGGTLEADSDINLQKVFPGLRGQ